METFKEKDSLFLQKYNGTLIDEYCIKDDSLKTTSKLKFQKLENRKFEYEQRWTIIWFKRLLSDIFLPHGFPESVSRDYLEYQIWDTLQAFCSTITAALSTAAIFKGVGVGNNTATVLSASLSWLLKDGTGMVGRIFFAWFKGTSLDSECKKWRIIADVLNDIAFFVDLITPYFPQFLFVLFACISSFIRSIVGIAGGATRIAIVKHQALRDICDVSAKDGSQETLVNLISLVLSLILLPAVNENVFAVWLLFTLCTFGHLYFNYRAVRSINFNTLNQSRFSYCVKRFICTKRVPTITECNQNEPLNIFSLNKRYFGCPLNKLPQNCNTKWFQMENSSAICVYNSESEFGYIALNEYANEEDFFKAVFYLEYFAFAKRWPDSKIIEKTFSQKMIENGWLLHIKQLKIDEWRYINKSTKKID